jgi:hypothetical protein
LPDHGRVGVRWTLIEEKRESGEAVSSSQSQTPRAANAFDIYTSPTADWKKVLHALDPDLYLVYRAPASGVYALEIASITDEAPAFEGVRWRESGIASQVVSYPRLTPWPRGKFVPLAVALKPLDLSASEAAGMQVEQEPNDTPEQAQIISLPSGEGVQAVRISGGADDL